jgi:hypothetical protein
MRIPTRLPARKGVFHTEPEIRVETIFPYWLENKIINALITAHPYEEVAYDIYPLENRFDKAGMGYRPATTTC